MKSKVKEELNCLVAEGTLEPVQTSEWPSPIVPVIKPDKSVRICGDFKQTVNPVSKLDKYPILKVEDLFVQLQVDVHLQKLICHKLIYNFLWTLTQKSL